MSYNIVHCSIDEHGRISGGSAGDQTGRECCVRGYYNKPWGECIRYGDSRLASKAAEIAIALARSNLVGYNQAKRNDLYKCLKSNDWNYIKYIKSGVKSSADCSSFMYAVWCCIISAIRGQSNAPTTSTAGSFYKSHGFKVLRDDKYLKTGDNNLIGDMLNSPGHHIAMFCSTTDNSGKPEIAPASPMLKLFSTSNNVKLLQRDLNYVINAGLSVDGVFGPKTRSALISFQNKYNLEADGIYGSESRSQMLKLLR